MLNLTALKEQLKKISPWPWKLIGKEDLREHGIDDFMVVDERDKFLANIGADNAPVFNPVVGETNCANGEFIASAPETISELVRMVEAYREIAILETEMGGRKKEGQSFDDFWVEIRKKKEEAVDHSAQRLLDEKKPCA